MAVAVAEHLHLDVPGPRHIFLDQHPVVAEGTGRLPLARRERRGELAGRLHPTHALAATPGHGLDQHGIAGLVRLGLEAGQGLVLPQIARGHRHAGILHQ